MARSQAQYLSDIGEAMDDATQFVEGRTLSEFREDRQLRYAVERALEIIGEATGNLSDGTKAHAPELPWREMRGLRNVVAHAYHRVDAARIWRVVTDDLPTVRGRIQELSQSVREEET